MPPKHEFVVLCPATRLLTTLVDLSTKTFSDANDGFGYGDDDCDAGADCWRLDHSRLIGGVNNTVQRRLLCRWSAFVFNWAT
jgi:hypothetical protein